MEKGLVTLSEPDRARVGVTRPAKESASYGISMCDDQSGGVMGASCCAHPSSHHPPFSLPRSASTTLRSGCPLRRLPLHKDGGHGLEGLVRALAL